MTNNIERKESRQAEALYKAYRANRQGGVKASAPKQNTVEQHETQAPSSAESLYAQHRRVRTSRGEVMSVDSLLDIVHEEYNAEVMPRRDQPDIADEALTIETISVAQGRIGREFDATNAADKRATHWWKRSTVGIAAAVVLAILLIPKLMETSPQPGNTPDTLPIALSNDALRAIAFIDPDVAGSFGFSDDNSIVKYAFNTGVLGVNLRLAVEGANQQLAKAVLRVLLTFLPEQSAIATNIDDLQRNIQTVYNAIDTGTTETDLSIQVQKLLATLEASISEENQLPWYLAGSSVESIRIGAEIALEHSDVTALEQALTHGKSAIKPSHITTINRQYSDLVNYPLAGDEIFVQANEIKKMAEDIKLVMR